MGKKHIILEQKLHKEQGKSLKKISVGNEKDDKPKDLVLDAIQKYKKKGKLKEIGNRMKDKKISVWFFGLHRGFLIEI